MKLHKSIIVFAVVILALLCACANGKGQNQTPANPTAEPPAPAQPPADANEPNATKPDTNIPNLTEPEPEPGTMAAISGEVVITFNYEKQSGSASNQYAVWIEDMNGKLINTLYATQWTARGGYKTRPDSIALWVEKSNPASMTQSEVDAVSGATPKTGEQTYLWDLTGLNGETVAPGDYKFFVEGTLRWKNYVLYSGVITVGDTSMTVQADANFVYVASDRQNALTDASPENAMIGAVTAIFTPIR